MKSLPKTRWLMTAAGVGVLGALLIPRAWTQIPTETEEYSVIQIDPNDQHSVRLPKASPFVAGQIIPLGCVPVTLIGGTLFHEHCLVLIRKTGPEGGR